MNVRRNASSFAGKSRPAVMQSGPTDLLISRMEYAGGWPGVLEQLKNFIEK